MKQSVIGITGGTGCGKTTALKALETLGYHIIDCDALYHRLLRENAAMVRAIGQQFPGTVSEGQLLRKELGRQVFSDPAALQQLNETVWPFVQRAVVQILSEQAPRSCAIDAIGLMESGLSSLCDLTVAVTAPEDARIRRLMAREGIDENYARLRIGAQQPNGYFSRLCNVTLENNFDTANGFFAYCKEVFSCLQEQTAKEEPHHE